MAIRHHNARAAEPAAAEVADTPTIDFVAPDMRAIDQREKAFDRVVSEVHGQAIRTSPVEMAQSLRDALSTQLFAYITGQSERTVQRWARGDVTDIRQESKRRLVTAYEILLLIDRFEAPGVAQTWFIGNEPQLDFVMPAKALREDQLEETLAAARHFVAVG
ncbi:MAG: XRE family transcriptional regulator [Chloroflexia bacterium]